MRNILLHLGSFTNRVGTHENKHPFNIHQLILMNWKENSKRKPFVALQMDPQDTNTEKSHLLCLSPCEGFSTNMLWTSRCLLCLLFSFSLFWCLNLTAPRARSPSETFTTVSMLLFLCFCSLLTSFWQGLFSALLFSKIIILQVYWANNNNNVICICCILRACLLLGHFFYEKPDWVMRKKFLKYRATKQQWSKRTFIRHKSFT